MTSEIANLANTKFHKSVDHAKFHMHCCIITFSTHLTHLQSESSAKLGTPASNGLHSTIVFSVSRLSDLVTGQDWS